jgi:predicted 3-demethylubiquinone-9 3-methyltransferase (glyoxalase superfamily)
VAVFNNPFTRAESKINTITRYGKEGFEVHGQEEGTVMTAEFTINRQIFTALNGNLFSNSMKRYHSGFFAIPRKRLIIIGLD